ncbi:DUF2339 domain-containing protein [Tateyamaria omphalii]|uniref:DUF2339 domain-containing protein n=1 Tax=Tateyamaria omphalii TaxID=299262 RepID=A0A1P8MW06_9RHOB|nr:DUF2339 domain-containing protein [Tateyamaria omphalii]APX12119.1 hypothetical protein BWR18_10845 [Tateyamaria omphalii]
MEGLLMLAGLVVLAIPIAVIYLLVAVSGLRTRIAGLEQRLAEAQTAVPAAAPETGEAAKDDTPDTPWERGKAAQSPPLPPLAETAAARVVAQRKAGADAVDTGAAASPPPPPPSDPPEPTPLMRFGAWLVANWFYAVSAVSLALAGLFLVQYGIENDLFPPTARVLAALGFGGALIVGGEVIRRRYGDGVDTATAYIPSVFSGAGLVSLFGGVAAARLLYDLIGVEVAFAGMAAVGLLGVGLGWLYGPLLAAVGVIGAFAAPLLVGSTVPATSWLFVYFGVVAAVGLGIDTIRRWAWVSVLSVALGLIMGWLTVLGGDLDLVLGFQAYVMVLAVLSILIPARSFRPDHAGVLVHAFLRAPKGDRPAFPTWLALGTVAAASASVVWSAAAGAEPFWMALVSLVILSMALIYWSVSGPALQDFALLPVVAALAVVAREGLDMGPVISAFADAYAVTPEADYPMAVSVLWGVGLLLSGAMALRALRPGEGLIWGLAAALTAPVMAITLEVTWQPALTIGAYPWALHAIALAAVMVGLALRFARADAPERVRASLFVLSGLASISFALVLILSLAALTVALAVTVLVAAWLDRQFKLPLMQVFIAVGVAAVGARLVGDPGLGWALDAPLWEMLLAYAGSLAAFVASLVLLRGLQRITARIMLDTAAWSTAGMTISLLLIRFLDDLLPGSNTDTHWAMGLFAVIWLGLMLVQLLRIEGLGGLFVWVRGLLAALFGLIGFGALALGLTLLSPLLAGWGDDVAGPPVLNTLIPAYLLPALLLGLAAWRVRQPTLRWGFGGMAVALLVYWAFATIRHVWQGPASMELSNGFLQPELYSYTVAILLTGAVLFYQSLARNASGLRRAGLAVIGLAVAKVFLIDISGLDGLVRVLSLVVLGLSLAGLAWLNRWAQMRHQPN